ncbi:MAG: GlxA family transcriptional regulator [Kiloniellales bacterium]|nr:GlxA family transcriptional regulator [Kiloniellales bacterium]
MFKVPAKKGPIEIAFYLAHRFSIVPFINAIDPLRMANRLSGRTLFTWTFVSRDGKPVEAINGMTIMVDLGVADAPFFPNAICCVGFDPIIKVRPKVKAWLRRLDSEGAHLGALGAGSIFLAEAGLLDGYRATIHWQYIESFVERFPQVRATQNLFEIDRNRFTCAGGTSAMDMSLHFIGLHFGHTLAAAVSDQFVTGEIRGSTAHQRLSHRARLGITNPRLLRVIDLMEKNIEEPLSMPELASQSEVSQRQMERLFKTHIEMSPVRFYARMRLLHARRLLHQSDLSVVEIGIASGFGTTEHFSRSYKAEYGRSPTEDRRAARLLSGSPTL